LVLAPIDLLPLPKAAGAHSKAKALLLLLLPPQSY
jgi:hypothetical protein